MRLYCLSLSITIFFCLSVVIGFGDEIKPMPEFIKDDKVLILAPHPDDETIGAGGAIQRALKAGADVKVVSLTNGDHNQLAFIVYEKRLTVRRGEFLHMGEVRRCEMVNTLTSLGISQDNIVFLGYPDLGTMEIFAKYWGKTKPFKSFLTRISNVSYPEAMSVGAPYAGESILKDLKDIIADFKPTKIFVTNPADTNGDHRSLYLFLQIALWDLEGRIPPPQVFPYIIHVIGWPKPRGYHPDMELTPPQKLMDVLWRKIELEDEEIKAKHNAILFYKSQIEYNPPYLFTFARRNELFGDFPVISLTRQDWYTLGADNDIRALAYAYKDNSIFIRLTLKRKIDKDFGISVSLFGYSKKIDFAKMPKIHLSVDMFGLHIKDKKRSLFIKDIHLIYEGRAMIFKVPMYALGNPDYILSCARTHMDDLSLDETAWRIIKLDNN